MKRILSLDGGGIHGMFTLEVLREMERRLADSHPGPTPRVLADHFDFIAGTSTGAIIAAMLSWGASVEEIERFYCSQAPEIFRPASWYHRFRHKFSGDRIAEFLSGYFAEADGRPATLGTSHLRTLLLLVLRNASTGSPWPVTNHPRSLYNDRPAGQSNLGIPLWQLIRASTAAPTFFPPQRILVGSTAGPREFQFIDGGVSPYNNPAYLAYLTATLPEFRIGYATGEDRLLVVSVGTGRRQLSYSKGEVQDMNVVGHVRAIIRTMMDSSSQQQDLLCRTTGRCLRGAVIDRELHDLIPPTGQPTARQFRYVRYNHTYSDAEVATALQTYRGGWTLDNIRLIPFLQAAGRDYARQQVRLEDLA